MSEESLLVYVIRDKEDPHAAGPPPVLLPGRPHAAETGSIVEEMIRFASHDHPNVRADNAEVWKLIEEATRGTSYAATIKPYQRGRDGRSAFLALVSQFAGLDEWLVEFKDGEAFLHNGKWKSNGTIPLEHHVSKHRLLKASKHREIRAIRNPRRPRNRTSNRPHVRMPRFLALWMQGSPSSVMTVRSLLMRR